MNNAEWIKLIKKQRERESMKVEEVKDNASIVDNGGGNNNGSDAGNDTGGENNNPPQSPEFGDNSGNIETGQSNNGDAE